MQKLGQTVYIQLWCLPMWRLLCGSEHAGPLRCGRRARTVAASQRSNPGHELIAGHQSVLVHPAWDSARQPASYICLESALHSIHALRLAACGHARMQS